jgi:Xaa-Pro aminopeptidase
LRAVAIRQGLNGFFPSPIREHFPHPTKPMPSAAPPHPALARIRAGLRERGLDALLVTHLPHVRLLTGFSGSNGQALVTPRRLLLQTDERYREQAAKEYRGGRILISSGASMTEELVAAGAMERVERLGFEELHLTVGQWRNLRRLARGTRLLPVRDLLEDTAACKAAAAVRAIERAARITDGVFAALLALVRPGMRENELAAEVSYRHRLEGAEGDAFAPIVLSGPRTSLIHGQPSTRALRRGDLLLFDIGCRAGGYCSDMTRMAALGRPSSDLLRLHTLVREAQERAREAIVPGARYAAADAAARAVLHRGSVATLFTHGLGHGVGLEIHERPRLWGGSPDRAARGHVVTVEPGIYLPGQFGIRCEDLCAVVDGGTRTLTRTAPELVVL